MLISRSIKTAGYFLNSNNFYKRGWHVQVFKVFRVTLSSLIIFLAASFFLIHRLLFFYPTMVDTAVSYIVYPLVVVQHFIVNPIYSFQKKRKSHEELFQQVQMIMKEKEYLQAEVIALQSELDFISDTQELILYQKRYSFSDQQLVHIMFKQLHAQEQFFLVDSGSNRGIKEGMVAIYKNCLLGRVTQVFPYYSKITLITDKRSNVAAYCAKTNAPGIVEGVNDTDNIELKFVSHFEKIQQDDLVLSSGQGVVFPRGFALGKITECSVNGLYYHISLKPLIDMREIQYCYLIQKGDG